MREFRICMKTLPDGLPCGAVWERRMRKTLKPVCHVCGTVSPGWLQEWVPEGVGMLTHEEEL